MSEDAETGEGRVFLLKEVMTSRTFELNLPIEIKAFKEIKKYSVCQTLTIRYACSEN